MPNQLTNKREEFFLISFVLNPLIQDLKPFASFDHNSNDLSRKELAVITQSDD